MGLNDRDYMHDWHGSPKKLGQATYNPREFRSKEWAQAGFRPVKTVLILGLVAGLIIFLKNYFEKEDFPPLPFPANGSATLYRSINVGVPTVPFKVISNQTQSGINYFVTVSDWNTNSPLMGIFILSRQTAEVKIPVGTYRISIAEGKSWYGPQKLFGKKTVIHEGINPTHFYQSGPNQFTGAVISLTGVINGNYPIKEK